MAKVGDKKYKRVNLLPFAIRRICICVYCPLSGTILDNGIRESGLFKLFTLYTDVLK